MRRTFLRRLSSPAGRGAPREAPAGRGRGQGGHGRGAARGGGGRGGRGKGKGKGRGKGTGLEAPPGAVVWDAQVHDPRPLNLGFVKDEAKNEIHLAHKGGIAVEALSAKHGLSVDRIKAILVLKDLEDDARQAGELHEGLQQDFERRATTFLKEVSGYYGVPVPNSHHRADTDAASSASSHRLVALSENDDEAAVRASLAERKGDGVAAVAEEAAAFARPAEPGAFVFRDLDADTTRVVSPAGERAADAADETHRSWAKKKPFWDTHAVDRGWAKRGTEEGRAELAEAVADAAAAAAAAPAATDDDTDAAPAHDAAAPAPADDAAPEEPEPAPEADAADKAP